MLKRNVLVGVVLLLVACATVSLTDKQKMFVACRGYEAALNITAELMTQMSERQLDIAVTVRNVVGPLCLALEDSTLATVAGSLRIVLEELKRLQLINSQVQK